MSTATTSTLSSTSTLNQPADARTSTERTASARPLAQKAQPASAETVNAHPHATPVTSVVGNPSAKPVDRRTIEGSTPGDFRAQASQPDLSPFSNSPGPREPVCQSKVTSSKLQAKPSVVPVPITGESLASNS